MIIVFLFKQIILKAILNYFTCIKEYKKYSGSHNKDAHSSWRSILIDLYVLYQDYSDR